MGQHDEYGKAVLREATGGKFSPYSPACSFSYCAGCSAHIDGVIGETIAVEVESRVPKQIRGAMMGSDLPPVSEKTTGTVACVHRKAWICGRPLRGNSQSLPC